MAKAKFGKNGQSVLIRIIREQEWLQRPQNRMVRGLALTLIIIRPWKLAQQHLVPRPKAPLNKGTQVEVSVLQP